MHSSVFSLPKTIQRPKRTKQYFFHVDRGRQQHRRSSVGPSRSNPAAVRRPPLAGRPRRRPPLAEQPRRRTPSRRPSPPPSASRRATPPPSLPRGATPPPPVRPQQGVALSHLDAPLKVRSRLPLCLPLPASSADG
ncbi:hypothetical protein SORBI_3008G085350 [Sorghum bicolor]|uniref:Uncharacterized protein n=1 Tax=Sorghum bicolor TaxID=4558 RepID=A0A1Z5R5F1_SORBI|nr:hypothetical protein SORBI_3008G085350 [Sorghum bicolor]